MTCTGDGSVGVRTPFWRFMNWARTSTFFVPVTLNPQNSEQLAAAVVQAETEGGTVKAVGSGWSYSTAAVDGSISHVISTALLNKRLSSHPTDPVTSSSVIPTALRDGLRPSDGATRQFVHVEAGITIYELNFMLDRFTPRLAMPTMGGANGQTLAGVLSTGTHGADYNLPPIADWVRAIHLVAPGGQEWWLERSGAEAITDPSRLAVSRDAGLLCSDIKIMYDDLLMRAALVSLGRMGIIYSVVLEVRPAFKLEQRRFKSTWSAELAWIRDAVLPAGSGDVPGDDRFREIVVNPYANAGERECMVTIRKETSAPLTSMPAASTDPFRLICDIAGLDIILGLALVGIPLLIGAATVAALAAISWMLLIPFVGPFLYAVAAPIVIAAATASIIALEAAIIVLLAAGSGEVAGKLAGLCNMASAIGQQALVRDIVGAFVGLLRAPGPNVVNDGFRLMTDQVQVSGPRPDDPECMRHIDGFEFAFDLSDSISPLADFMNDIFKLTDDSFNNRMPMAYGMSVRITRGTQALIGMQQATRTAHVEFFFLRGLTGQGDFYKSLHDAADMHGARPHWGLIHRLDASRVSALYGGNLTDWRKSLGRIVDGSGGGAATFRTTFSMDRNLEPLTGCALPAGMIRAIDRLQLRLKWGRVVSRERNKNEETPRPSND